MLMSMPRFASILSVAVPSLAALGIWVRCEVARVAHMSPWAKPLHTSSSSRFAAPRFLYAVKVPARSMQSRLPLR